MLNPEYDPDEQPARDEADENPDDLAGESTDPDHGLNPDDFEEED